MKNIKKIAVFSTVGVLSISSFACARNNDNGEIHQELSRVLDVNVENGEAVSSVLESEFGVSISDEASEYLDSSYVQAALENSMNDADYQQFANVSYQYFAQRIKEDNPEYENANIAVSYKENPMISVDNEVYLPDDISLIIYMARRLNNVLKNIVVHEDKMKENIFSTYGVIFSGRVMNYIIEKHNVTREEIYDRIQLLAFKAMETKTQLKELLKEDVYFSKYLNEEELNELFSYDYVFKNVDKIYKKVGVQKWNQL